VKVLFHCVYYSPEVGGLESHVRGLAEGLVKRGHEVRVVTSRSRPDLPVEEQLGGVNVRRTWMPSRSPAGWVAHSVASISAMRARARWADVVHGQSFASAVPAGIAARGAHRPWVVSFHTSHFLERAKRPLWKPVLGRLVRGPDRALAASLEIARVAESLAPGVHVEAMTNGVDTDRFSPRDVQPGRGGPPRVIVPRRLVPKNGVETFVRAFPAVRARIPGVRAVIAGDGPERARLESLSHELGVASDIEFFGATPHERMPELFASAQVAVVPSLMEATSVAALEAMACGLPVVASDVGGLPEIVDADVGALVPPGDPAALAEAIVTVLSDPGRSEKGRVARQRVVEKWSNDRLVERHLEIYRELIDGAARRGSGTSLEPTNEPRR
jgi:glycosyltransferase involved in cell wall biosynthesis